MILDSQKVETTTRYSPHILQELLQGGHTRVPADKDDVE
jgi:hypothetical protein